MQGLQASKRRGTAALLIGLLLTAAASSGCAGSAPAVIGQSGDDLKGGVPANGKEKMNRGHHDQAGAAAPASDADGGTTEHGKGHMKKQKPEKTDKPPRPEPQTTPAPKAEKHGVLAPLMAAFTGKR